MTARLLLTLTSLAVTLVVPASAQAEVRVYGPTATIRPGVALPAGATGAAALSAAGNEFESFQVVVDGPVAALSVEPGAELTRQGGGGSIRVGADDPASRMTIYREGLYDVPAEPGRSDLEGAVGAWPDALIPAVDPVYGERRNAWPRTVAAGGREVAWIDVHVPPNQPSGTYTGSVLVKDGGQLLATVPVQLTVRPFTLPSTTSLDTAFFTTYSKPCLAHTATLVCPDGAKLHALYARVALENRVTIANPWMLGVDQAPATADQQAGFRQYVQPLLDGTGTGEGARPRRLQGARLSVISQYWQCGAACLTSWRDVLPPELRSRFVFYACDEPPGGSCTWAQARERLAAAQAVWPGVKRLVTTTPQRAQAEAVPADVLAPVVNHVDGKDCCGSPYVGDQRRTAAYRDFLDPGSDQPGTAANRLWMYTSNMSHGANLPCPQQDPEAPANACRDLQTNSVSTLWNGWPGYVIDAPAAQSRAMGWLAYGYDVAGELYWHVAEQLPNAWGSQWESGGHGDGTLFYPGTPARIGGATDIPIESLRLKRIRDGREDHEYLRAAEAAGERADVDRIFRSVFGATSQMFNVTAAIDDTSFGPARAQLAALIEGAPVRTCDDPNAIQGTPGNDTNLVGTPGDDVINGLGGDDTIRGLGGDDLLCGGPGFDTLDGGAGDDTLDGEAAEYGRSAGPVTVDLGTGTAVGAGADVLDGVREVYGSPASDTLIGSDTHGTELEYLAGIGGDDRIDGRGGRDLLEGGAGADTLTGGDGADRLDGGAGADTLNARDAAADVRIDCGGDADPVATVDGVDSVFGCEQVDDGVDRTVPELPATTPTPEPTSTATPGPTITPTVFPTATPTPGPVRRPAPATCALSVPRQSPAGAGRRGLQLTLRCSTRGPVAVRLTVTRRVAQERRIVRSRRGGPVAIGRLALTTRDATVRVAFSPAARRALRTARSLPLTVETTTRAADGRVAVRRRSLTLRR